MVWFLCNMITSLSMKSTYTFIFSHLQDAYPSNMFSVDRNSSPLPWSLLFRHHTAPTYTLSWDKCLWLCNLFFFFPSPRPDLSKELRIIQQSLRAHMSPLVLTLKPFMNQTPVPEIPNPNCSFSSCPEGPCIDEMSSSSCSSHPKTPQGHHNCRWWSQIFLQWTYVL